MLNIESLMEMWKKDSVMDLSLTEIKDQFGRIPLLHSKYLDILIHSRLMLKKNQDKYYKMKKIKWEYYTGKLDEDTMKEWIEDEMTWSDVYAQRPTEYLEAVARGETPVWDSELKKFVYGDNTTETIGGESKSNETVEDPQAKMEVDEDLPF